MVSLGRINSLVTRYGYLDRRDINRVFQVTLWPILDLMMFGFVTIWVQQDNAAMAQKALIPLVGMLFWQIIVRSQQAFPIDLIEEIASKNLVNIASSPVTLFDWIIAVMITSIWRATVVLMVATVLLWMLCSYTIFAFGWWLLPIVLLLLLSGWVLGFLTAAIIMYGGQRMAAFAWASWIFTPFCGAFNPFEIIPYWMQIIGTCLPMTYTYMAIQQYMLHGTMPLCLLIQSFIINIVWIVGACMFFIWMVTQAKNRGLARLEVD